MKALDALGEAYRQDAAKVFETAESFAPAEKQVKDLIAARQKKAESVISAEQAAKLKGLIGPPFTGSIRSTDNPRLDRTPTLEILRAAAFGHYSTEFSLLAGNKSIQDELKMTADQVKKAGEVRDEILSKFPVGFPTTGDSESYVKAYAERSRAVEAELGKLLTAEQAKRFREVMLQSREPRSAATGRLGIGNIGSAASYPGVAEAVKVTDDQKKKLLTGTAPEEVLTADQKTAIAKLLGEPFKGTFTLPRLLTGGPEGGQFLPLISSRFRPLLTADPNLEEALKITPDQAKKLAVAREVYQTVSRDNTPFGPTGGGREAANKTLMAAREVFEKTVDEMLTPDQRKRAPELIIQFSAASSLGATLTAAEIAKALELTSDQTAKLAALSEDAGKLQTLLLNEGADDRERKLAYRLRDSADERMMAVLTDGQRAKWKELTGDVWPGLRKAIPSDRFGSGGGGGVGGAGRGGGGFGGGGPNP